MIKLELENQLKKSGYKGKIELSSLIDACGEEITSLLRSPDHWSAMRKQGGLKEIYPFYGKGETPIEAVANLWLQINNNQKVYQFEGNA